MNSKSHFQMYREMAWVGPVMLVAVRRNGATTGDWQGRWYRGVIDLESKKPSIIIEAPTIEMAVEKLHAAVMKLFETEADQAVNGLRRLMEEDKSNS